MGRVARPGGGRRFTGWTPVDPLLTFAIGALILVSSLRLLRESLHGLMEGAPFNVDPEAVGKTLAGVPGVALVHDLQVWAVKADEPLLSAHLVVRDIARWGSVMEASHALLAERFDIHHATLQPEPMVRIVHWRAPPGHDHEHV